MMAAPNSQELGLLPKVVLAIGILLVAAGVIWHGVTLEVLQRIWRDLVERPGGPVSFRFILQPTTVAIAAIHDGIRDARAGRSPYFWTLLSRPQERVGRLREGLNATAKIILLGVIMDLIYQHIVFKTFYPAEALIVALLFAFLPYLIIRGPADRIGRRWYEIVSAKKLP
jgi:hypothetical protein